MTPTAPPPPPLGPPPSGPPGTPPAGPGQDGGRPRRRTGLWVVTVACVLALGAGGTAALVVGDDAPPEATSEATSDVERGGADTPPDAPPDATDEQTEDTEDTEEPSQPERITLGPNDYLSPCQLVTFDNVRRIFGRPRPAGYVRREIVEESMSPQVFRQETDTLTRAITTTCTYNLGDDAVTSLRVQVDQHRSAREAAARKRYTARLGSGAEQRRIEREVTLEGFEWLVDATAELAAEGGGVPVRGDDSLLYVAGRGAYLTQARNAAVTLQYGPLSFEQGPLGEQERRFQDPRMLRLARLVARRVADPGLPQDPGPAAPDGTEEFAPGVPYVDACDVLTPAFHEALTGAAPDPGVSARSLPVDTVARRRAGTTPVSRTGSNDCERRTRAMSTGPQESSGASSTITVQYARTPKEAETLLEEVIINRYFDERDERRYTVRDMLGVGLLAPQTLEGVDTMYVFDSEASTGKDNRSLAAFARIGSRVFSITGFRVSASFLDQKYPTVQGFRDAVELLAADLAADPDEASSVEDQ